MTFMKYPYGYLTQSSARNGLVFVFSYLCHRENGIDLVKPSTYPFPRDNGKCHLAQFCHLEPH